MAVVEPFRAVRYDEARAGALDDLVAPPYDVLGPEGRDELRARSPHNVVHLTLPDDEDEAGPLYRSWLADGVLVEEDEPAVWAIEQEGRFGVVVALRAEPYEAGSVLPHERTHAEARAGRLRVLRSAGAQLEPIFLLHEGPPPVTRPDSAPDLEAAGTRLWRLPADAVGDHFAGRQLLIADGHHRYETSVAHGEGTRVLAVLVSAEDQGLAVLPTHRTFSQAEDRYLVEPRPGAAAAEVYAELGRLPAEQAGAVQVTRDGAILVPGREGQLDVELVAELGVEGIGYTPDLVEAVRRVEQGEASVAYLVRAPRVAQVFERARRGEVMPQKTTYFAPKLVSGLLFLPL